MKEYPSVHVSGLSVHKNRYRCGNDIWDVTNLIEKAKSLEPFDLPLKAIYSGPRVFNSIQSAYDLAKHVKRINEVDLKHPVILDEEGFIMDGWHRVTKAMVLGLPTIKAVRFDKTPPPSFTEPEEKE